MGGVETLYLFLRVNKKLYDVFLMRRDLNFIV